MNVFEAIQNRYSVRRYQPRPVEEPKLLRLLEAARLAPSASNRQEWRFIVVRDPQTRQALMRAESYWIAHITTAASNDHGYLGKSMVSLQDTIDEIEDGEDDDTAED